MLIYPLWVHILHNLKAYKSDDEEENDGEDASRRGLDEQSGVRACDGVFVLQRARAAETRAAQDLRVEGQVTSRWSGMDLMF